MKRILLSGTMFLAALSAMNAVEPVKDPATYSPVEGTYFKSLWMYSPKTENAHPMMNTGNTRGICCVDDKVYLPLKGDSDKSISHQINEFDANTGAFLKTYTLPLTVNGNTPGMHLNDLQADSKGNLAACNIVSNIQTGKFYVWRMKKGTFDKPEELLAWTWGDQGQDALRIDYFDVFGDVYGDGYILATVNGLIENYSNIVFKWNIVNGVASTEAEQIWAQEYVPAQIKTNGSAPRVRAISADGFYLDPSNAHPSYYDWDGNKVDGFDVTKVSTKSAGVNGVDEFELGGRRFLVAGTNNHGVLAGYQKNIAEVFDITDGMAAAKSLQIFPKNGLGDVSNIGQTVKPVVRKIDANTVDLIVQAYGNGAAAYRFSLEPLSVDAEKMSAMNIHLAGSELVFSEEAAKVDVYAVAGNCVAQFANVNRANLSLVKGIYIVKAMDMAGKTKVQKIVVE